MAKVWDEERKAWVWKKEDLLTRKQRAFVENYDGNISEAARRAGLSVAYGHRCSKIPAVVKALQWKNAQRQEKIKEEVSRGMAGIVAENARMIGGATAAKEDRQAFWTRVMLDEKANMMFRLKASELLGKAQGDFIERHEHSGVALLVVNPYDEQKAEEQRTIEAEVVKEEEKAEKELTPAGIEDPYAA